MVQRAAAAEAAAAEAVVAMWVKYQGRIRDAAVVPPAATVALREGGRGDGAVVTDKEEDGTNKDGSAAADIAGTTRASK